MVRKVISLTLMLIFLCHGASLAAGPHPTYAVGCGLRPRAAEERESKAEFAKRGLTAPDVGMLRIIRETFDPGVRFATGKPEYENRGRDIGDVLPRHNTLDVRSAREEISRIVEQEDLIHNYDSACRSLDKIDEILKRLFDGLIFQEHVEYSLANYPFRHFGVIAFSVLYQGRHIVGDVSVETRSIYRKAPPWQAIHSLVGFSLARYSHDRLHQNQRLFTTFMSLLAQVIPDHSYITLRVLQFPTLVRLAQALPAEERQALMKIIADISPSDQEALKRLITGEDPIPVAAACSLMAEPIESWEYNLAHINLELWGKHMLYQAPYVDIWEDAVSLGLCRRRQVALNQALLRLALSRQEEARRWWEGVARQSFWLLTGLPSFSVGTRLDSNNRYIEFWLQKLPDASGHADQSMAAKQIVEHIPTPWVGITLQSQI